MYAQTGKRNLGWLLRRASSGCKPLGALGFISVIITFLFYLVTSSPSPHPRIPKINNEIRHQFSKQSIHNTLIIIPVNMGMLHWAENLLCSLRSTSVDVSKITFWALDAEVRDTLQQKGRTFYHDPSLYSVSTNENRQGDTKDYKKMMLERPKFFIDILSTGFDILMLDADTIWFESPLALRDPNVDAVFSTDNREFYQTSDPFGDRWRRGTQMPPVCNGIFWMRASAGTVKLWQDMLDVFDDGWRMQLRRLFHPALWRWRSFLDDQRGMDVLLNDGRARLVEPLPDGITTVMLHDRYQQRSRLDIRLLDQTMVVNGHLLKDRKAEYENNLERLRKTGEDRIAVHLNWNTKELTKEQGAREMGLWLLNEDGTCKH